MFRILCALFMLAFLPISANAVSTSSIANASCSGDLTSSLLDGASFACSGNFTLTDGVVTSDSLINIVSSGDLFLDNVTFTAPNVTFSVLFGMMTIGGGVLINSSSIVLTGDVGGVAIAQGAKINILPVDNFNLGSGVAIFAGKGGANFGGATDVTISAGGSISLGASSGGVLFPRVDLPVVGGTLTLEPNVLLVNTGGDPYAPVLVLSPVPEPSTYSLMLIGFLGLIYLRRRV